MQAPKLIVDKSILEEQKVALSELLWSVSLLTSQKQALEGALAMLEAVSDIETNSVEIEWVNT